MIESVDQRRARVQAAALARELETRDPAKQAARREAHGVLNAFLRKAVAKETVGQETTEEAPETGLGLDQGQRGEPVKPAMTREEMSREMSRRIRAQAALGEGGSDD